MRVLNQIAVMALALSASSLPAHSNTGPDDTTRSRMAIYYGDLKLDNEYDAKIMMQRIRRGAVKACGGERSFSSYTGGPDDRYLECRETTVRKAVQQLDAPLVTRLYSTAKNWRSDVHRSIVAGVRN